MFCTVTLTTTGPDGQRTFSKGFTIGEHHPWEDHKEDVVRMAEGLKITLVADVKKRLESAAGTKPA